MNHHKPVNAVPVEQFACRNKRGKVVIIGNGISGVTFARHLRKYNELVEIHIISAETEHFFSRTALMYIYMGHMKYEHTKPYEDGFWEKNRFQLWKKYVERVDTAQRKLYFSEGDEIGYDILVIATGSKPNQFGWPGQDLPGVQGLYSYQDLELMEKNTRGIQRAVIVGGGLIGIEMAEMLHSRKIPVTFLVRGKYFWDSILPEEEARLVTEHIREHHIDLRLQTELKEMMAGEDGSVEAVLTSQGEIILCQFVGLTAGVSPHINFLQSSGIATDRGVLINHYFETNIPDVYAIGDCAQFREPLPGRKSIEQVWYTGRMHGEALAHIIQGNRQPYAPGPWFNSAKFFDIEYQTYGDVPHKMPEAYGSFFWRHPQEKKCLHVVYDKITHRFVGINVLGMRLRHECFDHWLTKEASVEEVMSGLKKAHFDPEFYKTHHAAIIRAFEVKTGIQLKKKAVFSQWFSYLNA